MTTKRRALEFVIYLVFLAVVCEVLTRFVLSVPRFTDRVPVTEDAQWRSYWLRRHQNTGKEIYYEFDIYDATKGWAAKPNLKDRVVFDNEVLNTNSRGLRGSIEYAYGKHPDKPRILVFGDSFTFGDEVSDAETYCSYLQQMLPHVEVVNMGVHGYGHDQMLILFQEEGVRYQPDIVVLGFVTMDMPRNVLAFRDYAKPKFVLKGDQLKLVGSPVPRPEVVLSERKRFRSRAFELACALWERIRKSTGLYDRHVETTTTAILNEFVALSRSIGATPVFVFLPTEDELSGERSRKGEEFLQSLCATDANLKCVSTRAFFEAEAHNVKFLPGGHWPPSGHLLVAEAIKNYLVGERLVAAPPE
jgi:hypothetical protein